MAIIKKILSLLFLVVLFIGAVACNKNVIKENSEEKPLKEENVVKVEEAEILFNN
ncbi:hypothetical protein MRBLBA21_002882 [Peribacillus frigoritolerans]